MKSRTSFFNTTVLKKDLTRFAPLWALFGVFQVLFVVLFYQAESDAAQFMNSASGIMRLMGMLNMVYAPLCALVLFGDLFQARLCNALHAMPLRREGWFLTHVAAGMLFCLIPCAAGTLVASAILGQYCYGAFLWLALMVLQFVFFFGVAVFSIQCSGNRLGAIAVYMLVNFFALVVSWLVMTFYEPVLYGVQVNVTKYSNYCPVISFSQFSYIETEYDNMRSATQFIRFLPEQWRYLFAAAAVGVLLMAVSVLIYRRRKLESAGDFIALKPVAPVVLCLYALCGGAVMFYLAEITTTGQYVFTLVGIAIGFFTGRMLLERKVNVFRKKNFLAFGLLALAFFGSIFLTWLDPIGITRYVPETEQVKSVTISPYLNEYHLLRHGITLTEQEDIHAITQIHRAQVEDRQGSDGEEQLRIRYTLNNGTVVERAYFLQAGYPNSQVLRGYYSSPEYVLGMADMQLLLESMFELEFYPYANDLPFVAMGDPDWLVPSYEEKYGSEEDPQYYLFEGSFAKEDVAVGLIRAMEADCLEGNMAQHWYYHPEIEQVGSISFQYYIPGTRQTRYLDVGIYSDCTHTVEYLRSLVEE